MKPLLRLLTAILLLAAPSLAHAYDFEVDGIYYNITSTTNLEIEVTYSSVYYNSYSGDVIIPDSVDYEGTTYTVTGIDESAFRGSTNLSSISMPDNITSIGSYAFYGCRGLTSITIPDEITKIQSYAFANCSGLTNITLPQSLGYISTYAFSACNSLESLTIPNDVSYIGQYAFAYCTSLKSVVLSKLLAYYEKYAFTGCDKLTDVICRRTTSISNGEMYSSFFSNYQATLFIPKGSGSLYTSSIIWTQFSSIVEYSDIDNILFEEDGIRYAVIGTNKVKVTNNDYDGNITIPENVTHNGTTYTVTKVGERAFYDCDSLTSFNIPETVTTIGDGAFYSCSKMLDVTIPNAVTTIGVRAFYYCSCLSDLIIPEAVTSIGNYAFDHCTSLTSIAIPDAVTNLGNGAFSSCTNLTSVSIGGGVSSIGDYTFSGCSSLTDITIPDAVESIGDYAFYRCSSLTDITIPDAVDSIGEYAFYYSTGLASVSIGAAVTSIGNYAFLGCTDLADVYSYNATPPTCASSSCFSTTTYSDATLHVPTESVSDYASATAWENFTTNVGDLETAVESISADAEEAQPTGYYSLSGQRIDTPAENEITIIRYSDGTAKKVFMK